MRLPRGAALPVVALIATLLPAVALAGPPTDPAHPELSQTLARLATPELRDATPGEQARALSLPADGPGSLARRGDRVGVEILFADGAGAAVHGLESAGAHVEYVSRRYQSVTATVDPADLRAVSDVPGVRRVYEASVPQVSRDDVPSGGGDSQAGAPGCGSINSEGDAQLNADDLRTALGVDGGGVKVGVISDSYDLATGASTHAAQDVASGDLPGTGNPCGFTAPVQVLADTHAPPANTSRTDEGRAMLQIVHDLAPGSPLAFADSALTQPQFADRIRSLRQAGSKVIVDDITYLDEPFFQKGPIDSAVDEVAAQGVPYFSDAANNNVRNAGNDVGSWEAPAFRPTACPAAVAALANAPDSCMDFDPTGAPDNALDVTFANATKQQVTLQWAEPWDGVGTDLDLFLLNGGVVNTTLSQTGANAGGAGSRPVARISFDSTGGARQLVVGRYSGPGGGSSTGTPRLKIQFLNNGLQGSRLNEYLTSAGGDITGPAIFGHNGSENGSSVAAVRFDDDNILEDFSARGPVTHYFGPVTGSGPAAALGSPQVLSKPDIAATNGGRTTFFGGSFNATPNHFFGTSAAAPHAAAVAALMLQANSTLTPAQVRQLQADSGRAVGAFGPLDAGAGLIDALASAPLPHVTFTSPAATNDTTPDIAFSSFSVSFSCVLDGGAPVSPCTSPFPAASPLSEAPHTLAVTATDSLAQSHTDTFNFTVDATKPVASIGAGPSGLTNDARPTFGLSANETATFECRFDSGAFAPCSAAAGHQPASPLADGAHTFSTRAIDPATNVSDPVERSFTVDATAPDISVTSGPAGLGNDPRPAFAFASTDSSATFECRFDGADFAPCATGFQPLVPLGDGAHTFSVRARDAATNASAPADRAFAVDTVKPRVTFKKKPPRKTKSRKATFTYSGSEPGVTFSCKLDKKKAKKCGAKTVLKGLKRGKHTFTVTATDPAGNRSSQTKFAWRVK